MAIERSLKLLIHWSDPRPHYLISHAGPCELSLISPIFKPLIFVQLIRLQFAFSINGRTQRKERERERRSGSGADFQIVFEMWTDCKWSENELNEWKDARGATVHSSGGAHLELLQVPGGVPERSITPQLSQRHDGGRERESIWVHERRKRDGELAGRVWFFFFFLPLSSCSFQSFLFYLASKTATVTHTIWILRRCL